MLSLSKVEAVILKAIKQRPEKDPYGNQINDQIEVIRGHSMNFAVMYSALHALEKKELITKRQGEATPERGGHHKMHFTLTDLGERYLENG